MKKLLLSGRTSIDNKLLEFVAQGNGWKVEKVINYQYSPAPGEDLYLYGPVLWTDIMSQKLGLKFIDAPIDFLPKLDSRFRRRSVYLSTAGNRRLPNYEDDKFYFLMQWQAEEQKYFIKPARDKCFEAAVYDTKNGEWVPDYVCPNTPILLSEPVNYAVEIRCFIRGNILVASSPYMKNMRPVEIINPEDSYWDCLSKKEEQFFINHETTRWGFKAFIDYFLSTVELPKTCVIDVGFQDHPHRKGDSGWQVIEMNNCINSGLYDCSAIEVLKCIEESKIE